METKIDEPSPNPRKKIKKALTGHTHSITTILLSKNESRLIVGTDDGMIYIWNIEDLAEDNEHITLETLKGSGEINNLVSIMKPYCLFGLNTKCGDKSLKPFLTKEGKSVFSKTVKSYQESIPQHIMIPSLEVDLHTLISNPHSKNYLGKSKEEMDSDYWSLSFSHFNQSFKSKKPEAKSIKFAKPLSKSVTIDEEKEPAKYKSSALGSNSALGRRVRGKSTVSKKPKKIQDKSKETIAELKKTIETLKQKVKQKDTKLKEFQNLISDLEKEGIECEIIDPRTVKPLDLPLIIESIKKTNRCVIVDEAHPFGGLAAEVGFLIQREAFDYLDAPVLRVTLPDVNAPFAKNLFDAWFPSAQQVVDAVKQVTYRN